MAAGKTVVWPKSLEDDNRIDPTGDAIVDAIRRVKQDVGYFGLPRQPVKVTITATFVTFGALGDREEPRIELQWEPHDRLLQKPNEGGGA